MTDRLTALRELLAKVEAGELPYFSARERAGMNDEKALYIKAALEGSRDAVKDLRKAVLPQAHVYITVMGNQVCVVLAIPTGPKSIRTVEAHGEGEARVELAALLKALIAQEEGR